MPPSRGIIVAVSIYFLSAYVAVTPLYSSTTKEQVFVSIEILSHPPVHPVKVEFAPIFAVKLSFVPTGNDA